MMPSAYPGSTLHQEDQPRLKVLRDRILDYMLSHGDWRTLEQVKAHCGGSLTGVSAKIRDLRKPIFGSWIVENQRLDGGVWVYRVINPKGQGKLF